MPLRIRVGGKVNLALGCWISAPGATRIFCPKAPPLHFPIAAPQFLFYQPRMPPLDRSIWISLGAGLIATAFVYGLSANIEASFVTAIASFLSVALLFDAVERRTSEAAPRSAAPAPGVPSLDQIDTLLTHVAESSALLLSAGSS